MGLFEGKPMDLVFRNDAYARRCMAMVVAVEAGGLRLDRTVFYPAGGGQPGDTGVLRFAGRQVGVTNAVKGDGPDDVLHVLAADTAAPAVGTEVEAEIDWDRRYRHMRMHTALHLLCSVVPGAVTGGQIAADKSRLDFDVPTTTLDKAEIAARINALIAADSPVVPRWISDDEMAAQPELVRTMSVKPPTGNGLVRLMEIAGVDLQPCGGTHVGRLGEIGAVDVIKIENKGKQNRRVVITLNE